MDLITTTSELAAVCTRLKRHPFVTIDTEFLRETTYYPILCVAQLASFDEAVVIDAMASGIDLAPFFELMADEKVLKVFHAPRHRNRLAPRWWRSRSSTQVAAMVLATAIVSYDQLVQRITGDLLDKSHRFTDWARRPLSEAQQYAAPTSHTCATSITRAADRGRVPTGWLMDGGAHMPKPTAPVGARRMRCEPARPQGTPC